MRTFTDVHSHFVYGVDDGAKTREVMEAMLDAAVADGVGYLFATPHVTPGVLPFDAAVYRRHFEEARCYCQQKRYPIKLYTGAEIMYTPAIERYVVDKQLPSLGGSENILVEFVPDISYSELDSALELMERSGYVTILAHIERYDCLYHKNAYRLKENHDIRYQVNCRSITDPHRGYPKERCLQKWFKDELIDFVATDSHDPRIRPTRMRSAYDALLSRVGERYANYLTGAE